MKVKRYLAQLMALMAIFSCSENAEKVKAVSLVKSETALDHSDILFTNFSLSTKSVGKDSILVYGSSSNQFGFFDVKQGKLVETMPIFLEGPNFMDFPLTDFDYRNEKLFVLSKNYFSIFNQKGEIIDRFGSSDLNGLFENYFVSQFELLGRDQIVFSHTHLDLVLGKGPINDKEYKLFSVLNLKDKTFRMLNIEMPKELMTNSDKGYIQEYVIPTFEIVENKLIYSFPYSADIHLSNLKDMSTIKKTPKINLISKQRDKANKKIFGTSEWIPYFYSSVKYSKLAYDPESKNFAQVAYAFTNDNSGNLKNTKYLFVYDESLNLINETEIEDIIMEPVFFTNHKILLQKSRAVQEIEDRTTFVKYEIKASDKPLH